MNIRFYLLLPIVVLFLSACATTYSTRQSAHGGTSDTGVAVIGVTARSGLEMGMNRNLLAQEFAELLAEQSEFPVLPAPGLRRIVGSARLDDLLDRYSQTNELATQDIQLLMAAGVPTRRAIVARLEEDRTRKLPVRREPVRNQAGSLLLDRERNVLATQRTTRVSAVMFDLATGRKLWSGQYRVTPVAELVTTQYLGSSFSGSLAAAFANTMVNGIRLAQYPDAPPLRPSMQALFREIARALPLP